jgi:two-component system sensor histidine kinase/response regulator
MDAEAPVLDAAVIESLRQLSAPGQPDVLRDVLQLFLSDAPMRLQAIDAACASGDAAALQRAAHTMKGASGTIGATRLQQACRRLEELARVPDVQSAPPVVESVRRAYAEVASAIRAVIPMGGA